MVDGWWWSGRAVLGLPLPHAHRLLLRLSLFPTRRVLQTRLHQIIGELGHGDLAGFGFVVEGADEETREGGGVVPLGHGISFGLVYRSINESIRGMDSNDYTAREMETVEGVGH